MNLQLNLYRIIQELLHNIVKHATADKVIVLLSREAEGITLIVEDNGIGFPEESIEGPRSKGQGLKNIQDRVRAFNGKLSRATQPGKGTHMEIWFPSIEGKTETIKQDRS